MRTGEPFPLLVPPSLLLKLSFSCMPIGAVCCDDNSSTYCRAGNYCITNGCCEIGDVCLGGGGGTITNYDPFPDASTTFRSASATRTAVVTSSAGSGSNDDSSSADDDSVTTQSGAQSTKARPTTTSNEPSSTANSEQTAQTTGANANGNSNGNSNSNSNSGAATSSTPAGGALSQRALDDKSLIGGMILAIAALVI